MRIKIEEFTVTYVVYVIMMDICHYAEIILSYTTSGKDLKNFMLVNKLWCELSLPLVDKFCNHLMTLLRFLPYNNWDYHGIFRNPNFKLEYFGEYVDKCPDHILSSISANINITIGFMKEYNFIKWNMYALSRNPAPKEGGIWNIVKAFPKLNWVIEALSFNSSITWDIIENNPDGINGCRWTSEMSANPNIFQLGSFDAIKNNGIFPLSYRILSGNYGVWCEDPITIINNNPGDWNYCALAKNLQISYNDILTWDEVEFYSDQLSERGDLTWKFIINNQNIDWRYKELLSNKKLPLSYIQKKFAGEASKEWHIVLNCLGGTHSGYYDRWYYLSRNPNLTSKFIMDNLSKPWDFRALSDNLFLFA